MFKTVFTTISVAWVSIAYAQDTTQVGGGLKISGYADVYYKYNLADSLNNYTSFTNSQNSFELGMISMKAEHSFGKVSVVGDLGFGRRAEEFSYNDQNTQIAIKQLFVTYAFSENLRLTAGSWATHIGYELVDAPGNRNYSMSYLFSYGPFFHTGIRGELVVGKSGFMLGLVNPTDLKSASWTRKYVIGQYSLALADEKVKLFLNGLAGKSSADARNNQLDAVLTGAASDRVSLGINGTIAFSQTRVDGSWTAARNWWGTALYINYDPLPDFGLTLRTEYFEDKNAILAPLASPIGGLEGGDIIETTLSGNIRLRNLTIIPEIRFDSSNRNIFYKHSGLGTNNSINLLMAAVYKF